MWLYLVALTVPLNMVKVVLYYVTFTTINKIECMAQSKKETYWIPIYLPASHLFLFYIEILIWGGGNDKGSLLKNLKNKNLKNLSDTTIQIQPLLTIHLLFHHAYLEVHMFIISWNGIIYIFYKHLYFTQYAMDSFPSQNVSWDNHCQ